MAESEEILSYGQHMWNQEEDLAQLDAEGTEWMQDTVSVLSVLGRQALQHVKNVEKQLSVVPKMAQVGTFQDALVLWREKEKEECEAKKVYASNLKAASEELQAKMKEHRVARQRVQQIMIFLKNEYNSKLQLVEKSKRSYHTCCRNEASARNQLQEAGLEVKKKDALQQNLERMQTLKQVSRCIHDTF